ncbi:hypothetical protein EBT25_17510, partial [bacterium]|nr:hypothetical protein [bacterium]
MKITGNHTTRALTLQSDGQTAAEGCVGSVAQCQIRLQEGRGVRGHGDLVVVQHEANLVTGIERNLAREAVATRQGVV